MRFTIPTRRLLPSVAVFTSLSLVPGATALAQITGAVDGTVTAVAGGRRLSDVQVTVVGTTLGGRTDEQGRYRIGAVPAGSYQVRTQRIGFASVTRPITVVAGQTATLNFSIGEAALSLDAVVVTGTAAESRKKEVGNAMATIDMKPLEVEPVKNTQDILAGRGPGITVMQNSGQPGAGGTIRLRGTNSITQSNSPVVYVDGVRIYSDGGPLTPSARQSTLAMNDIKADDIERIEIVKGAAATTLYGTEAAGGVIQIFTKKGSAGAPQWSLKAGVGANFMGHVGPKSDATGLFLNKCTGPDLHDAFGNAFVDPTCPASGSWLKTGMPQQYSLAVRGGSDAMSYYLSTNYDDNPGVVNPSDAKNGGFRGNFSFTPAKNLMLNLNSSYERKYIRWLPDGNLANGMTLNVMRGPFNNFKGGKGECTGITITCVTNGYILAQDIENNGDHFVTGVTLNYSPVTAFTNRFNIGFDYNNTDNKSVIPFGFLNLASGSINSQDWNHTKLSLDYAGSYQHSLHWTNIMSTFSWGGQVFDDRERYTGVTGNGFAGPADPTLESAATVTLGVDRRPRVVNAGYFLQEMLGWRDRLFVTGGLRVDGNSAFGKNFGLQSYPKVSVSYVVSEENFWPARFLPTFKLRAALGESGKAPGAFDAVRTWDPVSGDAGKPGVTVAQLGDPDLGPERTREFETGFDASSPGEWVSVEATYYHARTYGTLIGVTLPPSNGFNRTQLMNVGTIQNEGIELQISPVFLRRPSLDFRGRFSATWMKSEAIDLNGQNISTGLGSYVREGRPVPSLFGARITNPDAVGVAPIVATDQYIGPVYPSRLLSSQLTLGFLRRFSADAILDYQGGGYLTNFIGYQNALRNVWQPCYAVQQQLKAGSTTGITARDQARCAIDRAIANSDFWASKTDFLKLRSISLAYDVPERLVRYAKSATLIVAGQNLWRWTKYDGADPEANDATDAGTGLGRREYYQIPPFKSVLFSVRATF
jgi:TonB-dependent SusC/RagA subfamily outer membrane receptor